MKESLYNYMKLGINHHLLNFECFKEWNYHLETLPYLLDHPDFQVVDLFIPDVKEIREKEVNLIRDSRKEIVYNGSFMLPDKRYKLHSLIREERQEIIDILKTHAKLAIGVNASKFVITNNFDPGAEKRKEEKRGCAEAFYDFAKHVSDNSDMRIVLEPGDRDVDKNFLLGPIEDSLEVVQMVREKGATNFGLMVDMAHIPLLNESFEHVIKSSDGLLWHVHIGNCVLKDKSNPFYGDKHPPMGVPGGEHGVNGLIDFLECLLKYGYLNKEENNSVTIEVRRFPDKSVEETVEGQLNIVKEAWEKISLPCQK